VISDANDDFTARATGECDRIHRFLKAKLLGLK
jgi:hypothetical protein